MRLAVAMLIALAISIGGQGSARAASNVITVTDMSFPQEVTQSSGLVLIHFYADWVRGSRILSPTLDAIAVEYRGRLKVGKLNADENPVMPIFMACSICRRLFCGRTASRSSDLPGLLHGKYSSRQSTDISGINSELFSRTYGCTLPGA